MKEKIRLVLAVVLAALAAVPAALASPPTISSTTATAKQPVGPSKVADVSIAWTLPEGFHACSIMWAASDPLYTSGPRGSASVSGTSWGGEVVGDSVVFRVSSSAAADCSNVEYSDPVTVTIPEWVAPTPPPSSEPAPVEPVGGETAAPAPGGKTVEQRLAELEARVGKLELAIESSWTAYIDALAAGAPPYEAALAGRSAGLNSLYGLG